MLRANKRRHDWARIVVPAAAVVFTICFKRAVEHYTGEGPPLIFFYPAVIVSALFGGMWAGLFAMLLSTIATTYFYFGPDWQFSFGSNNDKFRLALYIFTSVALSWAFELVNRQRYRLFQNDRAKERFIGILCHELRIPMNRTLLQLSEMMADPGISIEMRQRMSQLMADVELETLLVQEVLLSVKAAHGTLFTRREIIPLTPVVCQAIEFVRPEADAKNIAVQCACNPSSKEAPYVFADKTALLQILWNLIRNAVKFSPISSRIQVLVDRKDDWIEIAVIDEGRGIEPENLSTIFEPYKQNLRKDSQDSIGGLGLGLWICKTLVDAHGGSIRAESEGLGKGSAFIVKFAPARMPVKNPYPLALMPRSLPVLIVEDDEASLKVLARLLSSLGIQTLEARTLEEAKAVDARRIACVIADMHLPDGTGWDLLEHFKARQPGLKVFCLSGDACAVPAQGHLTFDRQISKPISATDLASVIRSSI